MPAAASAVAAAAGAGAGLRAGIHADLRSVTRADLGPDVRRPARRAAGLLAAGLLLAGAAAAHEAHDGQVPAHAGLNLGVGVAAGWWHARDPWPAPALPAVLGIGDRPADARGWKIEHATVGLGLRASPQWSATLEYGRHADGNRHVEAAWLQYEPAWAPGFSLGGGRGAPPLGAGLTGAGHLDRFSPMPLAKRAVFNGDWIDDGLSVGWQRDAPGAPGLRRVDLGVWKAERFPGATDGPGMPLLHVQAALGPVVFDLFGARAQPQGRGAYVQRSGAGHVHTAPRCDRSLSGIVCFDGRVDLLGFGAEADTGLAGLSLAAAGLLRRERGQLYGANGDTRYRGSTRGGWLDLRWQPAGAWQLALRQEWLSARHRLEGPGASLLALDAGLLPNEASRRTTLMGGWSPGPDWLLSVEAARESIGGERQTVLALRLRWTPRPWSLLSW